ncbi:hypothetical protein DWW20_07130 [Ruminococcus sp. AF14-5]|nr:hypothetical protein DWW20_07130 [Ruminococcus sp. AF14-5]
MAMRKILVDETNRELCEHGTVGFPMTVNHDDLWAFEGKSVPIHWHNDLEISLPREGEAIYQVYQKLVDCLEKCLICRHIRRFAD